VSGGNITGSVIYDISARGGDLIYVTRTNGVPAALTAASAGSFVNTLGLAFSEPQVWILPSSTDSSHLIDLDKFKVAQGNPYQAKQLMEFIKWVTVGEFVVQLATGNESFVAVTIRGRVFSWVRNPASRLLYGVASVPESSSPIKADRTGLLGAFEMLSVKAAKTRFSDSERWTLSQAFRPFSFTLHPTSVQFYAKLYLCLLQILLSESHCSSRGTLPRTLAQRSFPSFRIHAI
jgi:hypothetical protein